MWWGAQSSDCGHTDLDLNLSFSTYQMCDQKQVTNLAEPLLPYVENGNDNNIYFKESIVGVK